MKIRPGDLSDEALAGLIDSFVLKEGTDYGHRDYSIQEKRDSVRKLLCLGKAEIVRQGNRLYRHSLDALIC